MVIFDFCFFKSQKPLCQSKYLYNATSYARGKQEGSECVHVHEQFWIGTLTMTNWRVKTIVDLSQGGYNLFRHCIICIIVFTNHQVIKCDDMAVKKGLFLDIATFPF